MTANTDYDLVITGGGPAGLTAGIYAMRAALKAVIVEKTAPGGQMIMSGEVENWPGEKQINGSELSSKFAEHAASYGLETISKEVECVQPGLDHHTVCFQDGEKITSHAVILATGGSPRALNIPGEVENHGKGVSYCAVCDGFFFRQKTVAVVGGGDTAAEEALYLAKLCQKVFLIHRRDELRAGRLLQQRVFNECKIEVVWDSVPLGVDASPFGVEGVRIKNVKTGEESRLDVEGVFIFIGFNPNNHLVPADVRKNADGYVICDEKCESSVPGIFVAGDLKEKYARQIVTAAADGATAALAAAHYIETRKALADPECELPTDLDS